jgi:hypothetical protein
MISHINTARIRVSSTTEKCFRIILGRRLGMLGYFGFHRGGSATVPGELQLGSESQADPVLIRCRPVRSCHLLVHLLATLFRLIGPAGFVLWSRSLFSSNIQCGAQSFEKASTALTSVGSIHRRDVRISDPPRSFGPFRSSLKALNPLALSSSVEESEIPPAFLSNGPA